ncbi:MAG: winged helix-turn-helix domain-containing protein [archaeon GB-1867-035]|nr:winged helix-turn-helix domain-containing protein [Candidatus Culexmicrobium profundum]
MNDKYDVIFKILSDPIRRKILCILEERRKIKYTEILNKLKLKTGRLNYHLKILENFIEKDENGFYTLTEIGVKAVNIIKNIDSIEKLLPKNKIDIEKLSLISIISLIIGLILIFTSYITTNPQLSIITSTSSAIILSLSMASKELINGKLIQLEIPFKLRREAYYIIAITITLIPIIIGAILNSKPQLYNLLAIEIPASLANIPKVPEGVVVQYIKSTYTLMMTYPVNSIIISSIILNWWLTPLRKQLKKFTINLLIIAVAASITIITPTLLKLAIQGLLLPIFINNIAKFILTNLLIIAGPLLTITLTLNTLTNLIKKYLALKQS